MSHVDLTVDGWITLSDRGAEGVAATIARDVGAALVSVSAHSYAGRSGRVALFERDGIRYTLVPGGTVELGYDPARFLATSRQLQDFAEAVAAYSVPEPIHRFLAEQLSPARRVTLPAQRAAARPW